VTARDAVPTQKTLLQTQRAQTGAGLPGTSENRYEARPVRTGECRLEMSPNVVTMAGLGHDSHSFLFGFVAKHRSGTAGSFLARNRGPHQPPPSSLSGEERSGKPTGVGGCANRTDWRHPGLSGMRESSADARGPVMRSALGGADKARPRRAINHGACRLRGDVAHVPLGGSSFLSRYLLRRSALLRHGFGPSRWCG
jgi:hypothetical protein